MKKKIITFIVCVACWLLSLRTIAQENMPVSPSWVSDNGYWVVESRHDSTIVHFYNNDNLLVFEERMIGRLDVDRKRTKLRLTRALEQAISRQNTAVHRQMKDGVAKAAGNE